MLQILKDRFLALGESNDHRIRRMQKFCYFQETILFLLNYFNGVMLALSFPIMVIIKTINCLKKQLSKQQLSIFN